MSSTPPIKRKISQQQRAPERGRSPPPQPLQSTYSSNTRRDEFRGDTRLEVLYRKDENEEGKKLTKTQIRKALHTDQADVKWYNQHLSDFQIKSFVGKILLYHAKVDRQWIDTLLDAEGVATFRQAFTHWSIPDEMNYELFEMLGDTTYNKIVAFYMVGRFKELMKDPDANYKLTEAGKLYKGRNVADKFSDTLGLPTMARWRSLKYGQSPVKIIEMDNKFKTDLFESFIGAVELVVDRKVHPFAGYSVVYNMLASLFDGIEMTTDLRKTKPATSQLKELVDRLHGERWFISTKTDDNDIIGMKLKLSFPDGLRTRTGDVVYEHHFDTGYVRGKEQGEDKVCNLGLKWLDEVCDQRW